MKQLDWASKCFEELGHQKRLEIILELVKCHPHGLATGEIAERLSISNSTLTYHISRLTSCCLIHRECQAQRLICTVNIDQLNNVSNWISAYFF